MSPSSHPRIPSPSRPRPAFSLQAHVRAASAPAVAAVIASVPGAVMTEWDHEPDTGAGVRR